MRDSAPRNLSLDLLRTLALWMVVIFHIAVLIYDRTDFMAGKVWWLSYILMNLTRMAVPLFFILSGYLFSRKNYSFSQMSHRAIHRLLIPYVVFNLVGNLIYNLIEYRVSWGELGHRVLIGQGGHLYFLTGLIVMYLLTPWFKTRLSRASSVKKRYLVIGAFVASSLFCLFFYYLGKEQWLFNPLFYWLTIPGYYLLGLTYQAVVPHLKASAWWQLFIFLTLLNLVAIRWVPQSYFTRFLESYFSWLQITISLSFFAIVKSGHLISNRLLEQGRGLLQFLSQRSYGLYLVHMMVLEYILHKTPINTYNPHLSLMNFMLLATACTLFFGYSLSYLLSRIPYLKLAIGEKRS